MIGIYKITNPENKIYIGQSVDIEKRFKVYTNFLSKVKSQKKIYFSLKKFGHKFHTFEVIEECDINLLNERERYWQEFYNVIDPNVGLNCRLTKTTDKSGKLSEEVKEKIRNFNLGRKQSEETKEKIRQKNKGRVYGEEVRNKVSKNHSRHNALLKDEDVIKICEIYKNGGMTSDVRKLYPNLKDCLLSQLRLGRTYRHITKNYNLSKPPKKGYTGNRKKILCVDDNIVFDGLKEAAEHYGVDFRRISLICNGKVKKPKINKKFIYV
jgi:group I intron endonuclease